MVDSAVRTPCCKHEWICLAVRLDPNFTWRHYIEWLQGD